MKSIKNAVRNIKDDYYTPKILVEPILKYIKPNSTIWCPFDTEGSEFVTVFKEDDHEVIYSHISMGKEYDFFNYTPEKEYDYIISNIPFSIKLKVLEKLYNLDKPFAVLINLMCLNYQEVGNYFYNKGSDLQLLIPDKKVSFDGNTSSFCTAYFCRDILPSKLEFCNLPHNNSGKHFVPSRMFTYNKNKEEGGLF